MQFPTYKIKLVEIKKSELEEHSNLSQKQQGNKSTVVQSLQTPFKLHEPSLGEQQGGCKEILSSKYTREMNQNTIYIKDYPSLQ